MNRVFLSGNLTRDPEIRRTPGGQAVADLGMAINDSYKDKNGEWVEKTCFVDVSVWGRRAEDCAEHLSKGSPVMVEGKLLLDQWESKTGEKRSKIKVSAFTVHFLNRPPRAEMADAPGGGTPVPHEDLAGEKDDLPF